jgi:alpha-D-ribose 1-methylphosphonate 5-triphosphate diphosphatase
MMTTFSIVGAKVLVAHDLNEIPLHICDGFITADGGGRSFDGRDYLILPGMIDIHGDGFEHHLAPRKGAIKDLQGGLVAAHSEIAANGITTAVMAQFYSWEGGMRGPEFAEHVFELLETSAHEFATDLIPQLRFEYLMMDHWDAVAHIVEKYCIPYIVFNDHVPHDALEKGKKPPRLTGQALKAKRNPDAHWALLQSMHDARTDAHAALPAFVQALGARGVKIASHDDPDADTRRNWANIGVNIAEFPESRDAAQAAFELGQPVIMGAPNVLRGASHKGNVSALELIDAGLCQALASDYHYPSMARGAFEISKRIGLGRAWDLVTTGPAKILGLSGRGILKSGFRADFIVVNAQTHRIEGVFASGRPTFLTGTFAERIFTH